MKNNKENLIFVVYIGVAGIRSEDIEEFVHKVTNRIMPTSVEGEIIIIPNQSTHTRIECINPKYITENELIEKNKKLIKDLNEELEHQLNILKSENDEKKN